MNGGVVRVRVELPGAPTSVRAARLRVVQALRDWQLPHLEEYAALLVSEVVTNAVLHARSDLAVEVRLEAAVVRVAVSDRARRLPAHRRHGLHAGTGRGLGLLDALATRWGSEEAAPPFAKSVWFELPLDPARLPEPADGAAGP